MPSYAKSGIKKVAIYDPATGTVVQINNLSPDGSIEMPSYNSENAAGNLLYAGNEWNFEFVSNELAGFSQLETWMKNETPVRLVVLGIEEHILWYESSEIYVKKQYGSVVGNRNSYLVGIRFAGYTDNIKTGMNLLHIINGWVDANTDEVADNYTLIGGNFDTKDFDPVTFVQNLGTSSAQIGAEFKSGEIIFPIAGAELQLSFNKVSLANEGSVKLAVDQYLYGGFDSTNNVGISTALLNFTTIDSFYKLVALLIDGSTSNGFDVEMKYPYLGVRLGEHKDITY